MTIEQGFEKQITENFLLRIADSDEEGEALAKFNGTIHDNELEEYVRRLYFEHPDRDEIYWFYIKDQQNDRITSAMTLLPIEWQIRGHKINVAEMGYVGTAEKYRGQGLFGIMNNYFDRCVKEKLYVLSALVGIPHFYRKYGYEFALSRSVGFNIPTQNIEKAEFENIKVRKATEDDFDFIEQSYNTYQQQFAVSTVFDRDKMDFRMMNSTSDLFNSRTYIVEENRREKGFFTLGSMENSEKADITLVSELTKNQMVKVLQFVKEYNRGNIPNFRVNVGSNTKFASYLKSRGADPIPEWTWQVQIPEIIPFFEAMKPIIEERIEESMFEGLNRSLRLSDYSNTVTLKFEEGKITEITKIKEFPTSEVDLRIPEPVSTRLFLSDRSYDEIKHLYTDAIVKYDAKLLIDTIFPKKDSLPFSYYQ